MTSLDFIYGKEYKPSLFFDICAFIALIVGIIIGLPAYIGYFQTGLVEKFPSLIFSCFAILMAILLWVTGIILQVIAKKHKQDYELYLHTMQLNKKE